MESAAPSWESPAVDHLMRSTLAEPGMNWVVLKQLTPPGALGIDVPTSVVEHSWKKSLSAVTLCHGLPAWLGVAKANNPRIAAVNPIFTKFEILFISLSPV